jgi:predicted enzyme related to lactoylglutathione lyase
MPNDVVHFAIHAQDCQRAKAFYEEVFGWSFEPWGPPEFWLIHTSPTGIRGALQKRRGPAPDPEAGPAMIGYECTIGVADVEATAKAVEEHGGQVTLPPMVLETVGTLVMFRDTEGNTVGAMQYEEAVR